MRHAFREPACICQANGGSLRRTVHCEGSQTKAFSHSTHFGADGVRREIDSCFLGHTNAARIVADEVCALGEMLVSFTITRDRPLSLQVPIQREGRRDDRVALTNGAVGNAHAVLGLGVLDARRVHRGRILHGAKSSTDGSTDKRAAPHPPKRYPLIRSSSAYDHGTSHSRTGASKPFISISPRSARRR